MAVENSKRDNNYIPTLLAVDMSTGLLPTRVYADESTHRLLVNAVISGGGASDGAIVDGVDGTLKATVFDYANSNPLGVVLRDTNGDYVSVGGGTQYTEDAVAVANPVGTALNLVRDDARGGSLTTTDGDNVAARGTNAGEMYVKHVDAITVNSHAVTNAGTFAVQAVLGAETTKVIGTVRTADGAGNLYTTNSTTYTAKFGQDSNLLGTLGTAFSTAGKVDVKAADGDVFVRQATGSNLHAVIDSGTVSTITNVVHVDDNSGSLTVDNGGTFAVQAAEADGANVTLGAKADAKSTATDTTAVSAMSVLKQISASVQAPPSQAVTNAGTFAVQAALAAETTKVIGVVRTSDGSGNLYSSNSSTYTAKFAQDSNLLGTLGTAFSTAGKVDIKGADGDVFVRNATAGNFLANVTLQTQTDTVMVGGVNVKEINGVAPSMGVGATGTGVQRVVQANDAGKTIVSKGGTVSSSGDNTIISAGTNKLKVAAFSLTTTSTTAVTCIFQSGASGTELWRVVLQAINGASTGANLAVTLPAYLFATASATLLNLNLSAAQTVHYSVSYIDEA